MPMADQSLDRNMPLTLRANFAWNFAGKMAYAASRALILVLIAKLGTAEMVGQYALAFAVTTPVFMLADMDLRSVLATDTKNRLDFSNYLGLRFLTTALAMAAVCVIALMQESIETAFVLLLVGAARGSDAISDMLYGLMQRHERLDRSGISLMIKSLLSLLTMGLLLTLRHSLIWGAAGMALAWLAVLLCYDLPKARPFARIRLKFSPKELGALLKLSLPLGGVLLFASLNKNLPNYFINACQGTTALGYFSSIVYILTSGSLVDTALSQSANARMAKLFHNGDRRGFMRVYLKIAALTAAMGVCMLGAAALFGGRILSLLYQPEYAAYQGVFVLVMGAAGMSYAADITASALTSARRFLIQPVLCGGTLAAGLALNFLLVPKMGLTGAALCILFTSFLQLSGSLAALAWTVRRKKAEMWEQAAPKGSGLTVERAASLDALTEETRKAWRELLDKNGGGTAFSHPEWLAAWWGAYGAGQEQLLLAVRRGDELIAFLPLMVSGRLTKQIRFIGCPQATHMDAACNPACFEEAAAALLGYLKNRKGSAVVSLQGLKESDGLRRALECRLRAAHTPLVSGRTPCYMIHTEGKRFDELYKSRFSGYVAKKDRYKETHLAALGKVSYKLLTREDIAGAFGLHEKRWMKKIDTSGFTSPKSREFFEGLLSTASPCWKAMALGLYLGDRLIAFEYGFICDSRAIMYKSAYDELFSMFSPGKMIKREYMRRCIGMGVTVLDFGVGFEEYKAEWTDEKEYLGDLCFPNRNPLSLAPFAVLYLKELVRMGLKRNRKVVLFKRNTLGRLRFHLSPRNAAEDWKRRMEVARRRGVFSYVFGNSLAGKQVLLRYQEPAGAMQGLRRRTETAALDDIPELALLMNCGLEELIKRINKRQECHVVRFEKGISCAAWMAKEGKSASIFDCSTDKRSCHEEDIVSLLWEITEELRKKECREVTLSLNGKSRMLLRAARLAGFAQAGKPDLPVGLAAGQAPEDA